MIAIPSIHSDLGISFFKEHDGTYIFRIVSKKEDSALNETGIDIDDSDIRTFSKLLDDSMQTGKRNSWVINSKPRLEIQIHPVPLYDTKWWKEQRKKIEKWPAPTGEQKLKMKENTKIIKAQGGYLPPHEYMFRIYINKKGIIPELNGLCFSIKDIKRLLQYFIN